MIFSITFFSVVYKSFDIVNTFLMFFIDFNILHLNKRKGLIFIGLMRTFLNPKLCDFRKFPNIFNVRLDSSIAREESTTGDID